MATANFLLSGYFEIARPIATPASRRSAGVRSPRPAISTALGTDPGSGTVCSLPAPALGSNSATYCDGGLGRRDRQHRGGHLVQLQLGVVQPDDRDVDTATTLGPSATGSR